MPRSFAWRYVAALAAFFAASTGAPAAHAELKVVATIKPIHALATRVMDGIGTPRLLVSGTASPHSFALKPSDARALAEADIFFRVSEMVEPFTARIVQALPATVHVVTLANAPDLLVLGQRASGTFEARAHAGHVHETRVPGATPMSGDGHIWLDPENAKIMVAEMARVLALRAPEHAVTVRANAATVLAELDALAAELSRDLAGVKDRPFVVFDDAYQYFENRFGLNAVGAITLSPEAQPSAKRLSEIRRKIAESGAVCVFAEPLFQPRLVAAVTEGTSARGGTLDPEGVMVEPGPDAYAKLMRQLASSLKECLQGRI